jgi:hypothetical protein
MIHLIVTIVLISIGIRLVARLLGFGGWHRHRHWGRYDGYGCGYGSGRPRFGGLGTILAIVALERLFGRRNYW